jgi:hypothetical protein
MNIFHLYAQDYNVGDHLLAVGVQSMFLRWFEPRILFRSFDIHTTILDQVFIDRINNEADLLLIGGGGLIHGIDRWMLHLDDELIETIKKPIIVFGVGYNFFRGEDCFSPILKNSLQLMAKKALSFSVRNDGSQDKLMGYGLYFPEVSDPGFFIDYFPSKKSYGDYVIVQLANDLRPNRGFHDEFNASIAALIKKISEKYTVILIPHLEVDEVLNDEVFSLLEGPQNVFKLPWHQCICREHLPEVAVKPLASAMGI